MTVDIVSEQSNLEERFIDHFVRAGLSTHREAPLLINDPTLLFTNSTIAPLKNIILNHNIPTPGLVIAQQCLRNQNFKNIYSSRKQLEYMSYFRMLGVLVSANWHEQLLDEIVHYFLEVEMINRDRIMCKGTTLKHFDLNTLEKISSKDIKIELDTQPINYYEWKYGLDNLQGLGLTFAIKMLDGKFYDVGNIIELKHENKLVGYEFGFGIETFLARKYNFKTPFHASKIGNATQFQMDEKTFKLQDAIAVAIVLLQQGILPGKGKRKSILRKAIYIICYFTKVLNISNDSLHEIFLKFTIMEFSSDTKFAADLLLNLVESHSIRLKTRIDEFIYFASMNKSKISDQEIIRIGSSIQQLDADIAHELLQMC